MRRRTFLASIAAAIATKALPAPAAPRGLVGDGKLHVLLNDKQVDDINRASGVRIAGIRERRHEPMWDTIERNPLFAGVGGLTTWLRGKYATRGRR